MFSILYDEIIEAAKKEYPKEMCGVVYQDKGVLKFKQITNISRDPLEEFVICYKEYSDIEFIYPIKAIVHSHPDWNTKPSSHDLLRMNQGDIPWIIVSYPDIDISVNYPTNEKPKLIGRHFVHGITDCWGLVRDFYNQKCNIQLTDYYREDEWWIKGQDLYNQIDNEGFYDINLEDIQYGDLILMQVQSPVINHSGIFVGNNRILHHMYGQLSKIGIYGGYYRDRTIRVLRHEAINTNIQEITDNDYENYY